MLTKERHVEINVLHRQGNGIRETTREMGVARGWISSVLKIRGEPFLPHDRATIRTRFGIDHGQLAIPAMGHGVCGDATMAAATPSASRASRDDYRSRSLLRCRLIA